MSRQTSLVLCTFLLSIAVSGFCAAQDGKHSSGNPPTAQRNDSGAATKVRQQLTPSDARNQDRMAVRETIDSFAKTFEARDAKSLAATFTVEGEFQNVHGTKLRGREALEHAFAEFFSQTPEVKADVHSESLRFLSHDSAIDEGLVTVQRGPTELATYARYSAFVVREDGAWRLALMSESPVVDEWSIADLGWLIGQWKSSSGEGAEIQTTYSWVPGKKFIYMQFSKKETNLDLSGTQIIGLDPATNMIHSWTFEANGGIGEADWSRDGDHWVLDAAGTLADGSTLTETNVLRRVNDDTFTWQSINRLLNDTELPDLAPIKISRMKTVQ